MRLLTTLCLCVIAANVWSQDQPKPDNQTIPNPFERPLPVGMGMGSMGMADMKLSNMNISVSGSGMGGMAVPASPSADAKFRANLPTALTQLRQATTAEEKESLQQYIREAFEQRYERRMTEQKDEIEGLRKRLAVLESDFKRRTTAKDRIVQLQLQRVLLASEGLLELNDLEDLRDHGGMRMDGGSERRRNGMGNISAE